MFFAMLLVAIALPFNASVPKPQECTHGCLVSVEGLQQKYSPGMQSNIVIRNSSKRDLGINVALDGLESGTWTEIAGSISDPNHSFSKMLALKVLKAGSAITVNFNPCETPILVRTGDSLGNSDHPCAELQKAGMPTLLRLRVDVHERGHGKVVQRVKSEEFRLSSVK